MTALSISNWVDAVNDLGAKSIPFLFIFDFENLSPVIYPLVEVPDNVLYKVNQIKNYTLTGIVSKSLIIKKKPVDFNIYNTIFNKVMHELNYGNTFLINLTFPTEISTNYSLRELFNVSHAKYKLYYKDRFIVSSPESFIQIRDNIIKTYPMKGTIDASVKDAKSLILNDAKETAEHYTIVDLLRNDLSIIANKVRVERFRYIDEIKTSSKNLYQVSSEISGQLEPGYQGRLGDIFKAILPAGSISGAPKQKTMDIIKEAEICPRGYYTGVFGIFDGKNVDSAVMIRYVEKTGDRLFYRSGCGITHLSDPESEYNEMLDKIYVPVSRVN